MERNMLTSETDNTEQTETTTPMEEITVRPENFNLAGQPTADCMLEDGKKDHSSSEDDDRLDDELVTLSMMEDNLNSAVISVKKYSDEYNEALKINKKDKKRIISAKRRRESANKFLVLLKSKAAVLREEIKSLNAEKLDTIPESVIIDA